MQGLQPHAGASNGHESIQKDITSSAEPSRFTVCVHVPSDWAALCSINKVHLLMQPNVWQLDE
jgi:hypothetical protein